MVPFSLTEFFEFPSQFWRSFSLERVGHDGSMIIIIVGWFCGYRFSGTCAHSIARSITEIHTVLLHSQLRLNVCSELLSLSFTLCLTGGMNVLWEEEGVAVAYSSSCACKRSKKYSLYWLNTCRCSVYIVIWLNSWGRLGYLERFQEL